MTKVRFSSVLLLTLATTACAVSTGTDASKSASSPPTTSTPATASVTEADVGTTANAEEAGPAPLPNLGNVPQATAPLQLSTAALPADPAGIAALWERLPPEVVGLARSPQLDQSFDGRSRIGYGQDRRFAVLPNPLLVLQALNSPQTNFFPTNWNAAHVIAAQLNHDREHSGAGTIKAGGRDGDLFWLREDTFMGVADSDQRFPVYTLEWGTADSPWIFSAQADTAEHLDALVKAFVDATKALGN